MKKQDFKIGMRVNHPEYGDGTVVEIEPNTYTGEFPIKLRWDVGGHNKGNWPPDYDRCTPIEPEFQYGDEVECTDLDEWPEKPVKGIYGFPHPDGIHHWVKHTRDRMNPWRHVRRPVKPEPSTPREEFEKATKCRSHDDIIKAGDRYVERTLAEARETWEKENTRLIWPTMKDILYAPSHGCSTALKWLATPEGQQWLRKRKEGGK